MDLAIERHLYDAMLAAAREAVPLEACGLLGGTGGHATVFYELTNADASGEHYTMKPEEQFAAIKDMRDKGVRMLAIWHSHPATPARMSDEDLRLAFTPDVIYLILSLAQQRTPELCGFVVKDGHPVQVELTLSPDTNHLTPSQGGEPR